MWLSGLLPACIFCEKKPKFPSHEHKGYLSTARRAQCCYLLFQNGSYRSHQVQKNIWQILLHSSVINHKNTGKCTSYPSATRAEIPKKLTRTSLPFFVRLQGLHINKIYSRIKSYKRFKDFNSKTHVNSSLCLVAMSQLSIICVSYMRFLQNTTKINKLLIWSIFRKFEFLAHVYDSQLFALPSHAHSHLRQSITQS